MHVRAIDASQNEKERVSGSGASRRASTVRCAIRTTSARKAHCCSCERFYIKMRGYCRQLRHGLALRVENAHVSAARSDQQSEVRHARLAHDEGLALFGCSSS